MNFLIQFEKATNCQKTTWTTKFGLDCHERN